MLPKDPGARFVHPKTRCLAAVVLATFLVTGVVRAWFNPSGAHGQRQVDTLGLSIALFHDLGQDGWTAFFWEILYPKVLQRGLSSGINAAEFPLLNLLSGPFGIFGLHFGAMTNTFWILALNFLAALRYSSRLLAGFGIQLPSWLAALLYFSITSITFQAAIPMPEGLSLPLLVIGAAWLVESGGLGARAIKGAILISLSVAVKPTAVVGLAPLLVLHRASGPRNAGRTIGLLLVALVFPAWWYTAHAREILSRLDGPQVFALARFQPFQNLSEVGITGVLKLVARQIDQQQFPFHAGFAWVTAAVILPSGRKWVALLLMALVGAISLDGPHIWAHFYYFFGANLISLCLMGQVLMELGKQRGPLVPLARTALLASAFWGALYGIRGNLWQTALTPDAWTASAPLRALLSPAAHLVTDDEVDATKLNFMGKPGTIAGRGISEVCRQPGYRSLKLNLLIEEENARNWIRPGDCLSTSRLVSSNTDARARWRLYEYSPTH